MAACLCPQHRRHLCQIAQTKMRLPVSAARPCCPPGNPLSAPPPVELTMNVLVQSLQRKQILQQRNTEMPLTAKSCTSSRQARVHRAARTCKAAAAKMRCRLRLAAAILRSCSLGTSTCAEGREPLQDMAGRWRRRLPTAIMHPGRPGVSACTFTSVRGVSNLIASHCSKASCI